MGEEKKKPEGEEKKAEEGKSPEPEKKAEKTEKAAAAAAATEDKPKSDEKKSEDGNKNKDKDGKDSKEEQPPPPPPEIVLRVYMHCEGCARKVRKCLRGFDGVEDVTTDCKTHKVVVKGEKADPLKVLSRVQKKTHRQVELLSPIPKPPAEEPKKAEEKEAPKPEEKKEEPKIITVVLKVHMHCEACSLEIKKRIEKMKEVEEATPDLKNSLVTVKGTFEAAKIVEYVYKRTGKHASIVSQDPPAEKKDDGKGKEGKEEKKGENDEGKKGEQKGEGKGDKKEEGGGEGGGGGEEGKGVAGEGDGAAVVVEEGPRIVELKRNEFNHYPPRYALDMYAYPPQIFSDENPNACSIM
ncbi:heavy metal-associated isoprenylated plant protein 7-like [Chenopodium quinoa]|uniref:heavy metal-associated isoprenylated plant protein 7-like n=1 Tax=Chenopodium quinoa TaxID=63459 RepID=UPI000B7971C8|nr:heavy metal-associated isoprenylated plant protein 7-like [Chenopodium quinoa]